jgi:hypothetical protein
MGQGGVHCVGRSRTRVRIGQDCQSAGWKLNAKHGGTSVLFVANGADLGVRYPSKHTQIWSGWDDHQSFPGVPLGQILHRDGLARLEKTSRSHTRKEATNEPEHGGTLAVLRNGECREELCSSIPGFRDGPAMKGVGVVTSHAGVDTGRATAPRGRKSGTKRPCQRRRHRWGAPADIPSSCCRKRALHG